LIGLGRGGAAGQGEAVAFTHLAENLPTKIPRAHRSPKHRATKLPGGTTQWYYPNALCSESRSVHNRNSVSKGGAPGIFFDPS
jgi:hypothetical protein